jgi:hypothetical protein
MIEAMRNLGIALVLLAGTLGCGGGGAGGGGGGWRSYPSPGTIGVTALWVFGPDDVWAGSQIVLHFDGASFTPVPTPPIGLVADFWGFAPDDLYAVSGASLLRWDGSSWSAVDFAGAIAPTDLQAIWGTSDDDLWLGDSLNGQVFHWNGTAWTSSITQTVEVTDLWGASQSAIYASGIFGLSRFGGSTWSDISDAVVSEAAGLWGFADDDVWAVGDFATLAHWEGAGWTDTFPTSNADFLDSHASVWGAAPDDVWAVGDGGAISHWGGAGWTQTQVGTFPYYPFLNKVHGSSAADVWAVGLSSDGHNTGVILHRTP